ncbi:MAG: hypothetical protein H6Q13_1136 [Bacteroidetes bacterium]|nr:hypothetical protein [Bacteroidota bacterium]
MRVKLLLLPLCVCYMLCCMSGCAHEAESFTGGDEGETAVIRLDVRSNTPDNISTRAVDEDVIHDLYILVYNSSGELTGKSYKVGAPYTVTARSGTGCKIYAIANTGNADLFNGTVAATEQKLKDLNTNISSWNEITNSSYLLMAGSKLNVNIVAGESTLTDGMTVSRLVAKVTLTVGISVGSGVTISGYRIYGIPQKSYYVPRPLGTEASATDTQTTRAEDASLPPNSGDWTDSGLVGLSNVSSFNTVFYMYENRAQKIKANVPASPADSAAYVIIYGKASGYTFLSWKIYLGANNTTNFNIKRNSQYTYTITLKPNDTDTRIQYKELIWAGSNIYWDGTKLTFDAAPVDPANPTTQELANQKKQGVCFQWGSLVGMSLSSTYVTYTPTYNSTTPSSSTWSTGSTTYANIAYFTDDVTNGGQTNTFLNDAARNADINYANKKGDICQYLSKTGAVSGSWRMATAEEFNTAGLDGNASVSWTTATTPWAYFGSFGDQTASVNTQGTFSISSGGTYIISGNSTSFPASGYRNSSDALYLVGQNGHCWSSSAYTGSTYGYSLGFISSVVYPANINSRQFAFAVRCVQN